MSSQDRLQVIVLLKEILTIQITNQENGMVSSRPLWDIEEINEIKEIIFDNIKNLNLN